VTAPRALLALLVSATLCAACATAACSEHKRKRTMLNDDEAAAVVRREGAAAVGRPERKVKSVTPVLPQMLMAELDDGTQTTLLILDGHVVTGKGTSVVARYLELLDFPKTHALDRDQLIALLTLWGDVPHAIAPLSQYVPGPHEEEAALAFDGSGALLTVYGHPQATPTAPFPPQPDGVGFAGDAPLLKIELRIDRERHFKWQVARWDGQKYQPHALP
jgi:hypothetical protein